MTTMKKRGLNRNLGKVYAMDLDDGRYHGPLKKDGVGFYLELVERLSPPKKLDEPVIHRLNTGNTITGKAGDTFRNYELDLTD